MPQNNNDHRLLDLIIDGRDISQYVTPPVACEESLAEWTVHTELVSNDVTSNILPQIKNNQISIKYRLRNKDIIGPWRSGLGTVNWRLTEKGNEELILHGIGRLDMERPRTKGTSAPVTAKIEMTTTLGGKVIERKEDTGIITPIEEDPKQKAIRDAQLLLAEEAEIKTITSPDFVLFLANSAFSSYRLLHEAGVSHQNSELLYSSLVFLPLSTEYFIKYMLIKRMGTLKNKHKNHKLLTLFDFLPFGLQKAIDEEFKNELENIGRQRTYQDLRVFLRKTENAFTVIRYLFDAKHAETHRHLLEPNNIAILTCVSNALERVSKRI